MIILLAASSITLTALQASINAPRSAFRECIKQANSKASNEKVAGDAFETYVRNACSNELGSFKGAVVKFDMGNKMSRKASDDDADAMIADFVGSAVDNYKYITGGKAPETQQASAPAPTTAAAITPPPPTPAAQPK